jgi:EpsD family peptidyl-prolyl cis-trans isomerase
LPFSSAFENTARPACSVRRLDAGRCSHHELDLFEDRFMNLTQPQTFAHLPTHSAKPASVRRWQPLASVAVCAVAVLLTACGDKKDKAASQTAAKVNKDEITVHQINFVLQQQRGLKPEQADAASKQILDRLIDQQLALQKGEDLKVDRDPRVVQQLEASRREILARAYLEKVGEGAPKPAPEEIKKYFDEKPALFRERRVYSIQEIAIEAKPEQIPELRSSLTASKDIPAFVEYLKSKDFKFSGNQAVRAAEQLPLNSLDAFAKMKDGQAMLVPAANGVQVVVLAGSRSQPVSEEQAKPAIEQYLLNERKRKLVEDDLKAMRAAAKIEYVGKFAAAASAPAGAASAAAPNAAPTAAPAAPAVAPAAAQAPAPAAAPTPAPAASGGLSSTDISKGMGLK